MSHAFIIMHYKENCKVEGEVITKIKVSKLYFSKEKTQKEIADILKCHYNTINNIIKLCKENITEEMLEYLKGNKSLLKSQLEAFDFFKSSTRRPKSNKRWLSKEKELFIIRKHKDINGGPKRMYRHLQRKGYDTKRIYTLGKIKGIFKRNKLRTKKKRTFNGERRASYDYHKLGAFEYLQYDTKEIADKHSLPKKVYNLFKNKKELPKYQWTIVDAKTKTRFLAWSYSLNSFFGFKFLELVICYLRAHNIHTRINVQVDRGSEFCSGSKRKTEEWNSYFKKHNVVVYDTNGAKWKQNLVERTHRIDDEEFYCPRGEMITNKKDFLVEAQEWIIYYNNERGSSGIGMNNMSPVEKLQSLGVYNAKKVCCFPLVVLEDFFEPLHDIFEVEKSQNVLTHYQYLKQNH